MMVGAIHFDQLQRHGGPQGVRDEGVIQSALARPRNKWAYEPQPDLATLAAAYGFGLTRNHGFIDGHKRVAFMAMYVFLGLNGHEIKASEAAVVVVMREVAASTRTEEDLAAWIRENLVRTRG
jgi:death-on-curing protein